MKTFTFNTLPPKIKQGVILVGEMYKNNSKLWYELYNKREHAYEIYGAAMSGTYNENEYYKFLNVSIVIWVDMLKTFKILTQEIKEELLPYIYGDENNLDTDCSV